MNYSRYDSLCCGACAISIFFLLTWLLTLGCPKGDVVGIKPTDETSTSTKTDSTAGRDSRVTTITFNSVAGKAGWAATPVTIVGWIVATIKARRRTRAADIFIEAIERVTTPEAKLAGACPKAAVESFHNEWINKRVACLHKKHGWGNGESKGNA